MKAKTHLIKEQNSIKKQKTRHQTQNRFQIPRMKSNSQLLSLKMRNLKSKKMTAQIRKTIKVLMRTQTNLMAKVALAESRT